MISSYDSNLRCRGFAFGTAATPEYDGASIAKNQNIVVVSFNYRTNVFGFPGSPDLPLTGNNLGFLDQGGCISKSCSLVSLIISPTELAFQWVKQNIAKFGGDPEQVTIMVGTSAAARFFRNFHQVVGPICWI